MHCYICSRGASVAVVASRCCKERSRAIEFQVYYVVGQEQAAKYALNQPLSQCAGSAAAVVNGIEEVWPRKIR